MAFGEQDTIRLCEQYRNALGHRYDDQYHALRDRLQRLEEVVQFVAAVQSLRHLTDEEIARLVEIGRGRLFEGSVARPEPSSRVRADRGVAP